MLSVAQVAELIAWLDDAERAAACLPVALPYGGLILVTLRGLAITGAADRAIGQLLAAAGRLDEAEERYRSALELEDRNRFGGHAAWTRYWYARLPTGRGGPGDGVKARELLGQVLEFTHARGMAYLHGRSRELASLE